MKYYSLNRQSPPVDFKEAAIRGQAPDKGLYFPEAINVLPDTFWCEIEALNDAEIAFRIIHPYVGGAIEESTLRTIVAETINFPIPLVKVTDAFYSLELFHGPTLAFKDVGARFMSRCLSHFAKDVSRRVVVLVATSGDTGGAVASSFYGVPNVDVVILYPAGKVSPVQEKQLTTLGKNIHALEVQGNFDDCQRMVKAAFADEALRSQLFLTSANSINVARWLPQQFYYAMAWKQWPHKEQPPVISVPSGNFGNICAGLLLHHSGLPVRRFIAACNANDVIPNYLKTGHLEMKPAVATLSNAMDVADPSNFVRVLELFRNELEEVNKVVFSTSTSDAQTRETIRQVFQQYRYVLDPHSAVAWHALREQLKEGERGIFLGTAHPVKFPGVVEQETGVPPLVPTALQDLLSRPSLKKTIPVEYEEVRSLLLALKNGG